MISSCLGGVVVERAIFTVRLAQQENIMLESYMDRGARLIKIYCAVGKLPFYYLVRTAVLLRS